MKPFFTIFFGLLLLSAVSAQDLVHLKLEGSINGIDFTGYDLLYSPKITERLKEMLQSEYPRRDFSSIHQGFILGNGKISLAYLSTEDSFDFKNPAGSNALLRVQLTRDARFQDGRFWLAGNSEGISLMVFFQAQTGDDKPEDLNGTLVCRFVDESEATSK